MKNPFGIGERLLSISFRIFFVQAMCCSAMPVAEPAAALAFQPAKPNEEAAAGSTAPAKQWRVEMPYDGDRLIIYSDGRERGDGNLHRAVGNVTITFLDMVLTCEEAEYNEETRRVSTLNPTRFRSKRMSLTSSGATFDPVAQTVTLKDALGYYYETSGKSDREFFLTGGMSRNVKAEKLDIYWGAGRKD